MITFPVSSSSFEARDDTLIIWLGMAGAMINSRGVVILIDPLLSLQSPRSNIIESGERLKLPLPIQAREIPHVEAVLYTHADSDHFGPLTAAALNERLRPRFLAPKPAAQQIEQLGVEMGRITVVRENDAIQMGGVEVLVTPAMHDWQQENPWKREDCCGYLVRTPDGAIWHPGDTRWIAELELIKEVDVLFFDIAAVESHLGPQGSARLAQTSGAKILLAYHYGTFDLPPGSYASCDPEDALPYIQGLSACFMQLNPGEPLCLPRK